VPWEGIPEQGGTSEPNKADKLVHTCTSPGVCEWHDIVQLGHQHKYEIHYANHLAEWILWFVAMLEERALTKEAGRDMATRTRMFKEHKLTMDGSSLKVSVFIWHFNGSVSASQIH
jgi:hypothetical protein